MKILDIQVMRGPNYWSNYRDKLIVLKLDIEELEASPTNKIEGFEDRLKALMPSLQTHRCSKGHEGGFFERVHEGTWMGHVIEHIAIELQTLAGMFCGFGRTRQAEKKGVYHVVFSYIVEQAGVFAAGAAVRIAEALIANQPYDLEADVKELKKIYAKEEFGPSTLAIVKEAETRNIPVRHLGIDSFVLLGQGVNQRRIRATMTGATSGLGIDISCDKEETKRLLARAYVPLAKGTHISYEEDLDDALEYIGFPVVIKPVNGNHGRGVTTNIANKEQALVAFRIAKEISKSVIVEKFVVGNDYRFLVINYRLVAVAKRTPAMVIGDGKLTIRQLIEQVNADPNRGDGHEKVLTKIEVDKVTEELLAARRQTLDTVPGLCEIVLLKTAANLSSGGTSRDVTDMVHPDNVALAERIARLIGLDVCGIDIVANDVDVPLTTENGAVIEVNACPGLRMHLSPAKGLPRNVAAPIIDMLYPEETPSRIPLVAVTGTNGKTTTTRLVAHMAKTVGHSVGFTTTDGIYINDRMICKGDCTGPVSAETVLLDPSVDFAVLECARGGILRSGLGFDFCDISIITNVTGDHLGLDDINSLDELAKVKMVVARSTFDHGMAILNADDDLVYDMRNDIECDFALFSLNPENERIIRHCEGGGLAAFVHKGYVVVRRGDWKTRIERVENIPLCFGGHSQGMTRNVLAAVLAGTVRKFTPEQIREALHTFVPSPQMTPGRMNLFRFRNCTLLIDYAHNTHGFQELKNFLDTTSASMKIGIVASPGDRRDEDIRGLGSFSAQMFDSIIIRHDKDLRGRTEEELASLTMEGIMRVNPEIPVKVIPDDLEAIRYAMEVAPPGAFITICVEDVPRCINFAMQLQEEEKHAQNGHAVPAKVRNHYSNYSHGTQRKAADNWRGGRQRRRK